MPNDDEIRLDPDFDETIARYNLDADRVHRRIEELEASGMSRGEARLRAVINAMLVVLRPDRNELKT